MMTPFAARDLEGLLQPHEGPCVSIFLPTHRTGREMAQDRIRLKNLLRQAESELEGVAIRDGTPASILQPARDRLTDRPEFWENLSDGLAFFLAPGFQRTFRVPLDFTELVVVAGAFHVKRLLPLVGGDGRFHVLALSQNHVRLLTGTRFSVEELAPEGLPRSLAEALWVDDDEKSLQMRSAGASGAQRRAMFHGHGAGDETEKTNLLRFFRRVDDGLRDHLDGSATPLVLAGVEHYFPLYREVSKHPALVEAGIAGSPEQLTAQELHDRAWAIMEPRFLKEQEDALGRYRASHSRTSDAIEEILPAAHHGRVDTLFVTRGHQAWGAYVPGDGGKVLLHDAYEHGDRDLLDIAAAATLKTGGRVFALESGDVPGHAVVAALLRY